MVRLFVRHAVSDYTTWRKHYDSFDDERRGMGVAGEPTIWLVTEA